MFRKPKKKKPSALRGTKGLIAGGDKNDTSSASAVAVGHRPVVTKRRRPRRDSSSSEEGEGEGTASLLWQIRQERDDAKSSKSSGASLLNTSTTASSRKKKSKGDSGNWMHQYKSSDARMTAQEMATRTAEYHPDETGKNTSLEDADGSEDAAASKNARMAALQKQPRNKFLAGPLRAATFVRTTARFDYQPDICKDYKETGFCGFGDTCIYLHDRGDTKTGWQMEQEYEEKKKMEEERRGREMEQFMNSMMRGEADGGVCPPCPDGDGGDGRGGAVESDDGIPFACHVCRGPFRNPIVTTCGHYFCESCMLTRIREVGNLCPVCQKDTHGVMNHAQKLVSKKRRLVGRDGTWGEYLEKSKGGVTDGDES